MKIRIDRIEDGWADSKAVGFLRTKHLLNSLPIYSETVKQLAIRYIGRDVNVTIRQNGGGRLYVEAVHPVEDEA